MRTIKFRGKRIFESPCWVYGYMVKEACGDVWIFPEGETHCNAGGDFYSENEPGICMVNPDTVGQFTGLLDKNGTEIYEGDVVKFENRETPPNVGVVTYLEDDCMFVCESEVGMFWLEKRRVTGEHLSYYIYNSYVVIGNIHDNPELLKETTN